MSDNPNNSTMLNPDGSTALNPDGSGASEVIGVYADWPNYIFHVPKDTLPLVQSVPTEIRECSLNWLRLQILALEDDPEAMTFPTVFSHFPEVTLGSLTFAKVMEMLEPYTITFEDGQYAVDLTGANSNFGDRVNVNQVSVRSANSAGMTSSPAIEYLAFSDQITIDNVYGTSGQTYPVGTVQYPVDNIVDGCAIADYRNITKIKFKHHNNVLGNDYDYTGFVLEGDAQATTSLHVDPLPNLTAALVKGLTFSGTVDGGLALLNCKVNGVNFFSGSMRECGLTDIPIILGGLGTATFNKCISLVAGANARPQIDFNHEPTNLAIRGWEGGLEVINKTNTTGEVSIDMNSGVLYIRDTCTAGEITVRGLGRLIDESGDGCVVKYEGLLDPAYVQYLTYAEHIWINEASCMTGTVYPAGTPSSPICNWTDALTLSDMLGIDSFMIVGSTTISSGVDITNKILRGDHVMKTNVTFEAGCVTDNCEFHWLSAKGTLSDTAPVVFDNCSIGILSNMNGFLSNCAITDEITLGGNNQTVIANCFQGYVNPLNIPPSVNMGATGQSLAVRGYTGAFKITNFDDPTQKVVADITTGVVFLDTTVTQGNLVLRGVGELRDLGHSANLSVNELISTPTISAAVWDVTLVDHTDAGSTGETLGSTVAIDLDPTQIADAVWDSATASHTNAGTFGGELAQASDTSDVDTAEISAAVWSYDPNLDGTALDKLDQITSDASLTRKHTVNKAVISGDERTVTIYDDDLTTVLFEFDVSFDKKVRTPV